MRLNILEIKSMFKFITPDKTGFTKYGLEWLSNLSYLKYEVSNLILNYEEIEFSCILHLMFIDCNIYIDTEGAIDSGFDHFHLNPHSIISSIAGADELLREFSIPKFYHSKLIQFILRSFGILSININGHLIKV